MTPETKKQLIKAASEGLEFAIAMGGSLFLIFSGLGVLVWLTENVK